MHPSNVPPSPLKLFLFGMARFMGFLPLRNPSLKTGYKTAKFGTCPTSFPGFWHNHQPRNPERVLLTFSWLDQCWSFSPGKSQHSTSDRIYLGEALSVSSGIFRNICKYRGHIANGGTGRKGNGTGKSLLVIQAVRLLKYFGLWRTTGQFLRPKESSKQI